MGWGLGKPPSVGEGARGSGKTLGEMPVVTILKVAAGKGFSNGIFWGDVQQVLLVVWRRGKAAAEEQLCSGIGERASVSWGGSPPAPSSTGEERVSEPLRAAPRPWGLLLGHARAFPLGVIRDNYSFICPAASLQEVMQD